MQVNEKKLEYTSICSYLAKIVITDENLYSKTKKYKSFWTPKRKQDDAGCWVKSRPPPSVNLGIGTGCLERGSQPMGGSFLRSCGWRRQSSEVLYVTYQHGLPFNQRVERKDKVKPSPPGTANFFFFFF